MKKPIKCTSIIIIAIFIFLSTARSEYNQDIIDKMKLSQDDLPAGFIFGKIPGAYKKILKDNPWKMDAAAAAKFAGKIYPNGDASKISCIYMAVITSQSRPYGDDLVCYLFLFKNGKAAEAEMKKLDKFSANNQDRIKLISKDNMTIMIFSGNYKNSIYIKHIAEKFQNKMNKI